MTGVLAKGGRLERVAYMLALTFLIGEIYYYAVFKKIQSKRLNNDI